MKTAVSIWNSRHAVGMIAFSFLSLIYKHTVFLAVGAALSFVWFVFQQREELRKFRPIGGYANWITALRLIMILIAAIWCEVLSTASFASLLTAAVLLDILDGYLARKYDEASLFGQYFDMETDAFFVLFMCFYFYLFRDIPFWILIPGLLRYFFRVFMMLWPKKNFVEKKKRYAAYIAGIFFTILLVAIVLPWVWQYYLLLFGAVLVVISFSISIAEYLRYDDSLFQ